MPNTAEYKGIEIRQAIDHIYADSEGNVYSLKSGIPKLLKPYMNKAGYYCVTFFCNSKAKAKRVHRLVATAWLPNLENKPETNHKNGIKTDNRVYNLEWATPKENTQHAFRTGLAKGQPGSLHHKSMPVAELDENGNIIRQWGSLRELRRETGYPHSSISDYCKGITTYAYGKRWAFIPIPIVLKKQP